MLKFLKNTKKWDVYVDENGVRAFKNKCWTVTYAREFISNASERTISVVGEFYCDSAIVYSEGKLGFDFPERIPCYVRDACYLIAKDLYTNGVLED